MGKLTLVLGGARSGKSSFAERLASQLSHDVLYIATAQALDQEMSARIKKHRGARPDHWRTLEIPSGIHDKLKSSQVDAEVIILDCLTLLVSNILMSLPDTQENPDENLATLRVESELTALMSTIRGTEAHWIIVSNEVGMGLVPPYPLGRLYRDQLGWANKFIANAADQVIFMLAGLPWELKPFQS